VTNIGSEMDSVYDAREFLKESKRKQLAFQKRVESILAGVPAVIKDPNGIVVRPRLPFCVLGLGLWCLIPSNRG
jgi:hypothetical protein